MADPDPPQQQRPAARTGPGGLPRGEHPLLQRLAAQRRQQQQQPDGASETGTDGASDAAAAAAPPPPPPIVQGPSSQLHQRTLGGQARTPTQRPAFGGAAEATASLSGSYGGVSGASPGGALGSSTGPSLGNASAPASADATAATIRVFVRVPGLREPLPVHVAMSIEEGEHREHPRSGSANATTGGGGASTNGSFSTNGTAANGASQPSSGNASDNGVRGRPATGGDLADAFVPVLQTSIAQLDAAGGTTPMRNTGSDRPPVSAAERYTAAAGAFEPSRWKFAHRGEFVLATTPLAGRIQHGDTVHAIFAELPPAEQERRRHAERLQREHAERRHRQQHQQTEQQDGGAADTTTTAVPAPPAPEATPPTADEEAVQRLLADLVGDRFRPGDLTPAQRRVVQTLAETMRQEEDQWRGLLQHIRNRAENDAAVDAGDDDDIATATTATAASRRAARQRRFVSRERWDEAELEEHLAMLRRRRERERGGANGAASPAGGSTAVQMPGDDDDPLRDPDPHAGQRVRRLDGGGTGGNDAAGVAQPQLTRLPGVLAAPHVARETQIAQYLQRFSGPDKPFMASFATGVILGPFSLLLIESPSLAGPPLLLGLLCGMLMQIFLVVCGNIDPHLVVALRRP